MFDALFQPVFTDSFTVGSYLLCSLTALMLGALLAITVSRRAHYSKSFLLSLILLPIIVQTVIMLVNGNIGTGVAVAGAFSLVRFRSVPGTAKEIAIIFLAMAIGLGAAVGYLGIAVLFTVLTCAVILAATGFAGKGSCETLRELKITVPESLNYAHAFDDLFDKYLTDVRLVSSKTTNMGSLYKLNYSIRMKDANLEQGFIDDLRCRNGNLEIAIGIAPETKEEL